MSTLTFPQLSSAPATFSCSLIPNTQIFESPLNRTLQTLELPGARWVVEMEFNGISAADGRTLKAFMAKLRGMAGRFYYGDYSHKAPAGSAAGTPLVNGASQSGGSLVTDGWDANQANLLLPGDYVGINGELKIITETIASDADGNATLVFEPPMRTSPADNTAVVTQFPKCTFRLQDDEQDLIIIDPERRPTVAIKAVEVF